MSEDCLYMPHPANTLRGKAQLVFRRLAYDFWRRKLNRFELAIRAHGAPTIVDVGCGPGFLLHCLVGWFPKAAVIGIDADEQLLSVAQARCKSAKLLKGDAGLVPLEDHSADVVFALHVVEHLVNPAVFFQEARRILRPDGLLIIATPNADGLGARLMKDKWAGFGDPTHISLNGPAVWRSVVKDAGFTISSDGTTGLRGVPWLGRMPLGLIHWVPTFFFGFFPWSLGEAYVCIAQRQGD